MEFGIIWLINNTRPKRSNGKLQKNRMVRVNNRWIRIKRPLWWCNLWFIEILRKNKN